MALKLIMPDVPVEMLLFKTMPNTLSGLVCRLMVTLPLTDIAPLTVIAPLEFTAMALVVPPTAPRVTLLPEPAVVIVSDLAPSVIVCPDEVNDPPLLNCRLYVPAPEPETSTVPPTVMPPDLVVSPIISVPAVIAARSADWTLKVPPDDPTEMDLLPFVCNIICPVPALTVPEKLTSLAII